MRSITVIVALAVASRTCGKEVWHRDNFAGNVFDRAHKGLALQKDHLDQSMLGKATHAAFRPQLALKHSSPVASLPSLSARPLAGYPSYLQNSLMAGSRLTPAEAESIKCLASTADAAAASKCSVQEPAKTLQDYLQVQNTAPSEALSNEAVQALIRKVEEASAPVAFDKRTALGDWQLCFQLNTKEAPASQKALAALPQFSNFLTNVDGIDVFRNIIHVTKNRVRVVADVAYTEPGLDSDKPGRLNSTISAAYMQVQMGKRFGLQPLRIPLPLQGKGWLELTYLSNEMRISRGNRGGLFVHLRPHLLTNATNDA
eukprot:gnl/TRDRNA2_/TRDRNA2_40074_c0_seq1.p1 gnl/TRDRNA2_/TRDRNA2_40074_c0~~gnl/TRDRNA2_/TRDRNA2_40074_c0_seq1.p1  ORF type:complete len:315 (-),score=49.71 gnl/TRDRNA2_/TRDRNA2_40074_c0_seq1:336-1280(-)